MDGNSVTKDMVAARQVKIGFTDTDDAKDAIKDGAPVRMVFPDQREYTDAADISVGMRSGQKEN